MESLELMVVALDDAENAVRTTREDITKHLVANDMTHYFSVDWAKLKRTYSHVTSDEQRRRKEKRSMA